MTTPLPPQVGDQMPPLDGGRLLGSWQLVPSITAALLVLAALYLWGAHRVRQRHPARPWPLRSSAAFLAGLAVIAVATQSSIAAYDRTLFWMHMVQHLLLIMVAPLLLVLGRPITLLLHASRNPLHRRAQQVLRSRAVRYLTHPALTLGLYTATIVGTHLSGFLNVALDNEVAHGGEHALYLLVGYLFFLPLVGSEPGAWRLGEPTKILVLLLAMPADTFTGLALLMTGYNPFPAYALARHGWGPSPTYDVNVGGAIMWIGGDVLMLLVVWAAFVSWSRRNPDLDLVGGFLSRARLATLSQVTGGAVVAAPERGERVSEDELLTQYNDYLARLAGGEGSSGRPGPP